LCHIVLTISNKSVTAARNRRNIGCLGIGGEAVAAENTFFLILLRASDIVAQ
jgi:hypothetical protein